MFNKIKRLFCKHKRLKTLTNLYGDWINIYSGMRSVRKCLDCGEIILCKDIDKNCKIYNDHSVIK